MRNEEQGSNFTLVTPLLLRRLHSSTPPSPSASQTPTVKTRPPSVHLFAMQSMWEIPVWPPLSKKERKPKGVKELRKRKKLFSHGRKSFCFFLFLLSTAVVASRGMACLSTCLSGSDKKGRGEERWAVNMPRCRQVTEV